MSDSLWGSVRTGDVDGNKGQEVLALTDAGLQAWSYDPAAQAWRQLHPSTPLALTGDWLTTPEYYATIQVGDVDGDQRDDVVARGPYGIRTWFYKRNNSGGWGGYLPVGYPDFPSRDCEEGVTGPCGQSAAFAALNTAARGQGLISTSLSSTLRDVWAAPTADPKTLPGTLSTLTTDVQGSLVGNCPAANKTHDEPPRYSSCIPPASNAFTADEWTTVVNEILSEIYFAQRVLDHFTDLETMREGLFESEDGSMPAIGSDLQLAGGAGNTTSFSMQGYFAGMTGIAASAAGVVPEVGPLASAALWVASELISRLPSASPTATSTFQTTYDGLLQKVATARDEMAVALASQSQQVRADHGLLGLVGQLRSGGTWIPDVDGMQSASRQAFAAETYQTLLPTMYTRYAVTNCSDSYLNWDCDDLPTGPYVADSTSTSATWLGPGPNYNPCPGREVSICDYAKDPGLIPDSIATTLWGELPDTCNYRPPNKNTLWTYGCPLGVPTSMIGADSPGWTFTTLTGAPVIYSIDDGPAATQAAPGVVRASAARGGSRARAAQAGSSVRTARDRARSAAVHRSAVRSRAACACAGRAWCWCGRCSSTVAARSSPGRARGGGCGR